MTSCNSTSPRRAEKITTDRKVDPPHYVGNDGSEVIDMLENFNIQHNMYRGQALQYMIRAGRKPGEKITDDLKKAIWYINRELAYLESKSSTDARMAT